MASSYIPNQMPQGNPFLQQAGQQTLNNPYGKLNFNQFPYDNYNGNFSQTVQNQIQFLKCRPVSSKEEAIASQIDLDGSLWVFTDVGNGKIYTKQINIDGTATFKTYSYTKDENPYLSSEYVTKDEFNQTIQSLIAAMQQQQQTQPGSVKKDTETAQIPSSF